MSDWDEIYDPSSGRTYYANMRTHETSWEMPPEFQGSEQPQLEHDPLSSFNMNQQQSQQIEFTQEPEQDDSLDITLDNNVITIGYEQQQQEMDGDQGRSGDASKWQRTYDPNSNKHYWYHIDTYQTKWTMSDDPCDDDKDNSLDDDNIDSKTESLMDAPIKTKTNVEEKKEEIKCNQKTNKLIVEVLCIDNDGSYSKKNIKLPSIDDWKNNLDALNRKISKKFKTEKEYNLLINGKTLISCDDVERLQYLMKDIDLINIPFAQFIIIPINSRPIIIHYNAKRFVFSVDKELSNLDGEVYNALLNGAKSYFKIKKNDGKIYEDVGGRKTDIDDWDDLMECLEDKQDDQALNLYFDQPTDDTDDDDDEHHYGLSNDNDEYKGNKNIYSNCWELTYWIIMLLAICIPIISSVLQFIFIYINNNIAQCTLNDNINSTQYEVEVILLFVLTVLQLMFFLLFTTSQDKTNEYYLLFAHAFVIIHWFVVFGLTIYSFVIWDDYMSCTNNSWHIAMRTLFIFWFWLMTFIFFYYVTNNKLDGDWKRKRKFGIFLVVACVQIAGYTACVMQIVLIFNENNCKMDNNKQITSYKVESIFLLILTIFGGLMIMFKLKRWFKWIIFGIICYWLIVCSLSIHLYKVWDNHMSCNDNSYRTGMVILFVIWFCQQTLIMMYLICKAFNNNFKDNDMNERLIKRKQYIQYNTMQ